MKFIPILFSTTMVQAILEGRKTMTRRVMKPQPHQEWDSFYYHKGNMVYGLPDESTLSVKLLGLWDVCPYGKQGDVLWVRETWKPCCFAGHILDGYDYKADHVIWLQKNGQEFSKGSGCETGEVWKPSLFMPKSACRIFLEVTDVRVQRLHDISEQDAIAEGAKDILKAEDLKLMKDLNWIIPCPFLMHQFGFLALWCKINGTKSWEANPFVWTITFKRIDKPENFN